MLSQSELVNLVKSDRVHRRVYTDPEIFELEQDRIFWRLWLYVAHESQLKTTGDFVRSQLGRYEVIVTRHDDDAIYVLRNSCAHRGARLCTEESGHQCSIVCPYHAWNYRCDGSLISVPHKHSYADDFDLDDSANWLVKAPRVESYRGFVFASWADEGSSLTEQLGRMTEAIDNLVDRAPAGDIELAGGSFSLEYPGNWKLHMENANDTIHPGFVHASSVASGRAIEEDSRIDGGQTRQMLAANGFTQREWDQVELVGISGGHSYMGGFYKSGIISPKTDDPVTVDYRNRLIARHGEEKTNAILGMDRFNNLLYPTISINAQYHQLRVVQPVAVDRTLIKTYCFRLQGAPDEIFQRAVRFLTTLNSPASMIFADDVEIFRRCQQGLANEGIDWLNIERGLATDVDIEPGITTSPGASELPTRVQMQAWLHTMTGTAV